MDIVRGEIDRRRLAAILARWNALKRRGPIPVAEDGREVIQWLCDDLSALLVAFGCERTSP